MATINAYSRTTASSPTMSERIKAGFNSIANKIREIAAAIFEFLKWLVSIPARYLGSKTWSLPGLIFRTPYLAIKHLACKNLPYSFKEELLGQGYSLFCHKKLSTDESKPYLKHLSAAAALHSSNPAWIEPFGFKVIPPKFFADKISNLTKDLEARKNSFFNPKTGFKLGFYEKNDQVFVVFGTLNGQDCEIDDISKRKSLQSSLYKVVAANLFGMRHSFYDDANNIFTAIKSHPHLQNKKLTLIGQCFGGSIASYIALKHNCQAVCINSLPIGVGLQQSIGDDKLRNAEKQVTQFIIKGDYTSDANPALKVLDFAANILGLRTFGNFGKKVEIPSVYNTIDATHQYPIGSLMHHLGYHHRIRPQDLKDPKARDLFKN